MEYKAIRTIRAETLLLHKPPYIEFARYLKQFGYGTVHHADVIAYARENNLTCWVRWLENHGFIKKIEKPPYRIGQRFIGELGNEYILSHIGDNVVILINTETGNLWNHGITVKNLTAITQDEFIGFEIGNFKLKNGERYE